MSGVRHRVAGRAPVRILAVLLMGILFVGEVAVQPADAGIHRTERQMAKVINQARKARGLRPLKLNHTLSHRARKHSAAMRAKGTIFHSNLRRTLRGVRWRVAGENVGMGPGIRVLHRAFMHSPGHRANILYKRYRKMGVGIRWSNGVAYVTVIFIR